VKFPDDFINKVICGNCLEIMKDIPDNSIDLVVTDPPYQIRWKQQMELHGRKPFYHNFDQLKGENGWDSADLKELYRFIFPEFDRILKKNGSILMFTSQEGIGYMTDEARRNNLDMKATIFWHKTNPIPQVRKKNYLSAVECIVWIFRRNPEKVSYTINFKTQKEMQNWFEFPICGGQERTNHPTQKPLKLINKLIEIHSNENDIVLDPFLGSGTTAVACKKLNRRFIGIEINPEYCKIAEDRLKKVPERLDNILKKVEKK